MPVKNFLIATILDLKDCNQSFNRSDINLSENSMCTEESNENLPNIDYSNQKGGNKLQNSRNARIPFSVKDIEILTHYFNTYEYLNSTNVKKIAETLNTSENRIKNWFQNKRARQKKKSNGRYRILGNSKSRSFKVTAARLQLKPDLNIHL